MIPNVLRDKGFRFIKVLPNKAAFETAWQKTANYVFNNPHFNKYLTTEKRYGVATGFHNLMVIDFDNKVLWEKYKNKMPETFTVLSLNKKLPHLYYFVDEPFSDAIFDLNRIKLADIQGPGRQVIGPNSEIGGKKVTIANDVPITKITARELKQIFSNDLKVKEKVSKLNEKEIDPVCATIKENITTEDVLRKLGCTIAGPKHAACPFHESRGDHNRCLSFNEYGFHCFDCERSGSLISLYAEAKGLPFPDAKIEMCRVFNIPIPDPAAPNQELAQEIETISATDILKQDIQRPEFIIEDLVPEFGVTYIAAPPGEGKSLFVLRAACSIASGRDLLGLKVKKGGVIIFDCENGEICDYNRLKDMAEGENFSKEELKDLRISIFPNIILDPSHHSWPLLIKLVDQYKPRVVVFDSLVRTMRGSENDAESTKLVFDALRGLLQKRMLSVVVLHHLSKMNDGGMNALRGSSEIAAAASSIILLKNSGPGKKLKLVKSRYTDLNEHKPVGYTMTTNDKGMVFNSMDVEEGGPSDAVSRTEEDFWQWIETKEIKIFSRADAKNSIISKGHSESAFNRMLSRLKDEGQVLKLSHGKWEVKRPNISTEEEEIDG